MTEIRAGEPADLDRLREIQQAALDEPWEKLLETAANGPLSLLVLVESEPVGYAILIPGPEGDAYVPEFAIDPARHREGLGTKLLQGLCEDVAEDGFDRVLLTAQASDTGAQRFYRENGFEPVERLPNEYESGDGIRFVRSFHGGREDSKDCDSSQSTS